MDDKKLRRIGIMGGTFDPIHNGHLLAAMEARAAFDLSEVILVPTGQPPHKANKKVTPAEERYLMTEMATINCPYFTVSRIEIDRPGNSYTIDTLKALKAMPRYKCVDFYFITGLDAILDILSWKSSEEIFEMCNFVAVSRHGYSQKRMDEFPSEKKDKILPLEIPLLAISSTELRSRIRNNRSIRFMVPPEVEQYIIKKSLYKD